MTGDKTHDNDRSSNGCAGATVSGATVARPGKMHDNDESSKGSEDGSGGAGDTTHDSDRSSKGVGVTDREASVIREMATHRIGGLGAGR